MTRPADAPAGAGAAGLVCLPATPCALAGRRVLVVEDDPLVLATHDDLLREWGCVVIPARDGEFARALSDEAGPIDAVVTDYRLPGMTGLALIDGLRVARPWLPAIVVSAERPVAWPALGERDVMTARLIKPAPADRLRALLVLACCRRVARVVCPLIET